MHVKVFIVETLSGSGCKGDNSVWFTEEEAKVDRTYKEEHYGQVVRIKVFMTSCDFGYIEDIA